MSKQNCNNQNLDYIGYQLYTDVKFKYCFIVRYIDSAIEIVKHKISLHIYIALCRYKKIWYENQYHNSSLMCTVTRTHDPHWSILLTFILALQLIIFRLCIAF